MKNQKGVWGVRVFYMLLTSFCLFKIMDLSWGAIREIDEFLAIAYGLFGGLGLVGLGITFLREN